MSDQKALYVVTPNGVEVYRFVVAYKQDNDGNSPSYEEIKDGCGLGSKSTVGTILDGLEDEGLILRPGGARNIEIVGGRWSQSSSKKEQV